MGKRLKVKFILVHLNLIQKNIEQFLWKKLDQKDQYQTQDGLLSYNIYSPFSILSLSSLRLGSQMSRPPAETSDETSVGLFRGLA